MKRKFYLLAALLELAESQFMEIRASREQHEKSIAVRVSASVPDLPVDIVSMKSFIEQDSLVAEIDAAIAAIRGTSLSPQLSDKFGNRRSRSAILAGMTTLEDVRNSLKKYRNAIIEYARGLEQARQKRRSVDQRTIRGASVQLLSNMLVNLRGPEATAKYFRTLKLQSGVEINRQVAIAKAVVPRD